MNVKIEISTDGYPMPMNPTADDVLSVKIQEQESILNAIEAEKTKAVEKKALLESIVKEASRPRGQELID